MSLAGKHALITGGSRGIGRGIALKLAENGAKIAVHYYQNERAANDTLGQVRKHGSDGLVIQADVTRPDQITDMVRKVRAEFGTLDIFVSNARPEVPAFFQPPMDITLEQWDAAFNSQAKAFLVGVREAVVSMAPGSVMRTLRSVETGSNVPSRADITPAATFSPHSTTSECGLALQAMKKSAAASIAGVR